jgi:hypothetical protein
MQNLKWKGKTGLLVVAFAAFLVVPAPVGAESLTAVVPTPPPSSPPTITDPDQNATFTEKHQTVRGGCLVGLIVKVFSNTTFAGSTTCLADSTYELQIDLEEGANSLVVRQYDSINQPSPESNPLVVYYTPPTSPSLEPGSQPGESTPSSSVAKFELKIDYDYTLQTAFANQAFRLPIRFAGGTPPYAVSIEWGDGETTLLSRQDANQFVAEHSFKKSGPHQIKIRISDRDGEAAFLQFVVIVNGAPGTFSVSTPFGEVRTGIAMSTFALLATVVAVPSSLFGFLTGWYLWKKRFLRP